jgi:hypothetical protein
MLCVRITFWFQSIDAKRAGQQSLECSISYPDTPDTVFISSLLRDEKGVATMSVLGA